MPGQNLNAIIDPERTFDLALPRLANNKYLEMHDAFFFCFPESLLRYSMDFRFPRVIMIL